MGEHKQGKRALIRAHPLPTPPALIPHAPKHTHSPNSKRKTAWGRTFAEHIAAHLC